jgi:hypothetical protein
MRTDIGVAGSVLAMVHLAVEPKNGDSVVVNNLAGAALNYYSNTCSVPAGTIAVSGSQTFTTPAWIQSQGPRTSVRITGGQYGAW